LFSVRLDARFIKQEPQSLLIEVSGPSAEDVREDLVESIIVVNGVLLIFAIGASYVLARITLNPLKRAYDEQRRFIADASHELRTPLAVMHLELENELADPALTSVSKQNAKSHLEEVAHMAKIVQNLLLLSVLENQQETTKIIPIDVSETLLRIERQLHAVAVAHHVSMILENCDHSVMVKGNEHVFHILRNIIQNGILYNKPDGQVIITQKSSDTEVCITIRDTGIGIAAKDLEHIFDRFYRVDQSHSRSMGGSGLGLSIVERGIASLEGRVSYTSELGKGTEVIVVFQKYKTA